MELYARHGDLVIAKTKISGDLQKTKDLVFAGDSSGHPHTLKGACEYRKSGRTTSVRLAKDAKLVHGKPDGHKTITLEAGDYEVYPLRERHDGSDRAVED